MDGCDFQNLVEEVLCHLCSQAMLQICKDIKINKGREWREDEKKRGRKKGGGMKDKMIKNTL